MSSPNNIASASGFTVAEQEVLPLRTASGERLENRKIVNVASVKHHSPFRYPGGKTWLVPLIRKWIASLPQPVKRFAEPFAGGAIVSLSVLFEDLAENITLIEKDSSVGAVW